jgi:hypothetical protein
VRFVNLPSHEQTAWHGMAWHGMAWHGMARIDTHEKSVRDCGVIEGIAASHEQSP